MGRDDYFQVVRSGYTVTANGEYRWIKAGTTFHSLVVDVQAAWAKIGNDLVQVTYNWKLL